MAVWIEDLKSIIDAKQILTTSDEITNHSYDWWPLATKWRRQNKQPYRPDAVVRPQSTEEVSRVLAWAAERKVSVTPWGAGSSVTGAPLTTRGGISLDMSAMNAILAMDETSLLVKVQAGKMGHKLEAALTTHGYTLNHSPQSLDRSTVGGWLATRATGQFSSRWGGIEDLVVSFTVVLPSGEVVEMPFVPRAAIGPDIRHLFIGAEGTLGVITDVTLKMFPHSEFRRFEAITFPDVESGVRAMRHIMQAGLRPFLVRFYDNDEARHAMQDITFQSCVMFLGFEGLEPVAQAEYVASLKICKDIGGEVIGSEAVERWMQRRFDFSAVERILATPGGYAETIEVAHFWTHILDVYQTMKDALTPISDEVLGHFSHVYSHGTSLYLILLGQSEDDAQAEAKIQSFWDITMKICLEHGAALSHHHGVGLARHPYVADALGNGMHVLQMLKQSFDPNHIMNPGKLGFTETPGQL